MDASTPVIIGTPEPIAALAEQVYIAAPGTRPIGCITIERTASRAVGGLKVLGAVPDLGNVHAALRFTTAVVTLPRSAGATIAGIRTRLRELGVAERFVPPLEELLSAPPVAAMRPGGGDLNMVDLIGRVPYGIDRRSVARVLEGRRVVITGAGGSIGSELARIVATFHPELLVLMERSENALFEIDRQLAARFPHVRRQALLHDVVDADGTRDRVGAIRPHVVFHAAAHKHVPLMEDHPAHAVSNNLFGTKSILDASIASGAERFVLISSDKAVNPTSVMGATQRLAEIYTQAMRARACASDGRTRCGIVRFGNVLGSACSVLPIWQSQLAEGGPITVTDARMTRYFMTIHEAATLVIQSAAMDLPDARPPIFVLDMGEPLSILDLAERFVRLHGYEPRRVGNGLAVVEPPDTGGTHPDVLPFGGPTLKGVREASTCTQVAHVAAPSDSLPAITIRITGIRPGEKLHEELAYAAENLLATPHPGIRAWASDAEAISADAMVDDLARVRSSTDRQEVLSAIQRHVSHILSAMRSDIDSKPIGISLAA